MEAPSFAELIVLTYKYDGLTMNSVIKKLVSSGKRVTMLIHNEVSMSSWDDIYELIKWIHENGMINLFSILITRLESKAFYIQSTMTKDSYCLTLTEIIMPSFRLEIFLLVAF